MNDKQNIEERLIEELVPIFGLDSTDDIKPDSAMVRDLGAESIDFIEILYMIENVFGVKLKIAEITMNDYSADGFPADAKITAELAAKLNSNLDSSQYKEGQSVNDIFQLFTVHNLATVIYTRLNEQK